MSAATLGSDSSTGASSKVCTWTGSAASVPSATSSAVRSVTRRAAASMARWPAASFGRKVRTTFVHLRNGRELGAGPGEVDDRLLLVERPFLAREVEARDDDRVVNPVRDPLARLALGRKGGASVGPDARLDRVEHVRDPHRLARPHDVDVHARERLLGFGQPADAARARR